MFDYLFGNYSFYRQLRGGHWYLVEIRAFNGGKLLRKWLKTKDEADMAVIEYGEHWS